MRMMDPDQPKEERIEVRVRGLFKVRLMDTLTGSIQKIPVRQEKGETVLRFSWFEHDSLLLELTEGEEEGTGETVFLHTRKAGKEKLSLPAKVPVELSEPNVLLLDMAEYRLDGGEWQPEEEILRIDRKVREQLGYPLRSSKSYQPYMIREEAEEPSHIVELRYTLRVEAKAENLLLALENAAQTTVFLDEKEIDISERKGYYTDEAIETAAFPSLEKGEHILRLVLPFRKKTNLEWSYLLGDFGVRVQGRQSFLTGPVRELAFGDWCPQGLPFYGGNVTYLLPVEPLPQGAVIEATQYRSPLITLSWEDKNGSIHPEMPMVFSPYQGTIPAGADVRTVRLTAYGSRINTFGQVHDCDETMDWFGADSWRTQGSAWSYEYHLHRMGVLKSPEIFKL